MDFRLLEKPYTAIWKRVLLARMVALVWVVFFLNFVAVKLFLYSLVWWFDMPMHFLGGMFLAILSVWLCLRSALSAEIRKHGYFLLIIGFSVLCIGIFWELFELGTNIFITFDRINIRDTASDLFFDLSGGMIGIAYALRKMPRPAVFVENKNTAV